MFRNNLQSLRPTVELQRQTRNVNLTDVLIYSSMYSVVKITHGLNFEKVRSFLYSYKNRVFIVQTAPQQQCVNVNDVILAIQYITNMI